MESYGASYFPLINTKMPASTAETRVGITSRWDAPGFISYVRVLLSKLNCF